ncbi:MAG: FAD-dependent oxidoreductase [Myxococcota bacterium]
MARSQLFTRLQNIARKVVWGYRQGIRDPEQLDRAWAEELLRRREFVKLSLGAVGMAALPGALGGCGDNAEVTSDPDSGTGTDPGDAAAPSARVAVIGGGLAGMHCAYRLNQAGVKATVYEASGRLGGRTYTTERTFPDNQLAELGGELIDTNHQTLWDLQEEFDLVFDDRFAEIPAGSGTDLWWVDGAEVPDSVMVTQMTAVADRFAEVYTTAEEGTDEEFAALDNISLKDWLNDNVPLDQYRELHTMIDVVYVGEYGLNNDQQSVLNLIYLIDFETTDPFRMLGESDERYHAHEGSQIFVTRMAETLDADQIQLQTALIEVHDAADGAYRLVFEDQTTSATFDIEVDHVVMALPFTALRKVTIDVADFSADKREVIDELGYGTNCKVMASFTRRVWNVDHDSYGTVSADLPFQQGWDTSIGQDGKHGIYSNFLGGTQGEAAGANTADDWFTTVVLPGIEDIFPGMTDAYLTETATIFHWPSVPTQEGSYTCYKPGQWQYWETEGVRERNIHFCGEHCSPEFQGWMEGAAETGAVVAGEILDDLGIAASNRHQAILRRQLRLPHPCFHGDRLPKKRRWQHHRKLVRARLQAAHEQLRQQRARALKK